MRHFQHLSAADEKRLFDVPPTPFTRDADPGLLATALGATLYCPATRPALAADLARAASRGAVSVVVCLEDSVADGDLAGAEANAVEQLRRHAATGAEALLVFLRVRHPEQVERLLTGLGDAAGVLTGLVLPKFTAATGRPFLAALEAATAASGHRLLAMPVLESPEVMHRETRVEALTGVRDLLQQHRERVLAVRIGATDLAGLYGLRRSRGLTAYDVHLVAGAIADVVNLLGRSDGSGFTVTGPVWEHYERSERLFKTQLRQSPFDEHAVRPLRAGLIAANLDGLIREIVLDHANGLLGKTVIHPSHVGPVHALSVVTHEEHSDARDVLSAEMAGGGVRASGYGNKMNESKPHRAWAERVMLRAQVFGVSRPQVSFVDLLRAVPPW